MDPDSGHTSPCPTSRSRKDPAQTVATESRQSEILGQETLTTPPTFPQPSFISELSHNSLAREPTPPNVHEISGSASDFPPQPPDVVHMTSRTHPATPVCQPTLEHPPATHFLLPTPFPLPTPVQQPTPVYPYSWVRPSLIQSHRVAPGDGAGRFNDTAPPIQPRRLAPGDGAGRLNDTVPPIQPRRLAPGDGAGGFDDTADDSLPTQPRRPAPGGGVGGFACTADDPPHYGSADISRGIHEKVWQTYNKVSKGFDEKKLEKWNKDLDTLLIFVSLMLGCDLCPE